MTRISIVVPALDEAMGIAATLMPLQPLRTQGHEIIVVDGGSGDATLERAGGLADQAFVARRGRAAQMNAGAAAATGKILLFLHADTQIRPADVASLPAEMARSRRAWGRFDVSFTGPRALRVVAALMNLRSRVTGIATGDQAIFVERARFHAVGGFPDQPLMEDIELSRRLRRACGPPLCVRARVVTSGRRWEHQGFLRTIVGMWQLRFAYWRGIDPERLAAKFPNVRPVVSKGSNPAIGAAARHHSHRAPTLQVFAKAPVPGAVKGRLARAIGDVAAASVHKELAERTLAVAVAARSAGIVASVELWCAPDPADPAFAPWRERYDVTFATQFGSDLGVRMRHALESALRDGRRVILIGSDCPVLDTEYLAQAARALDSHAAVFGPAEDGGYVLVGLARPLDVFSGIAWGKADVMAATRARLEALRATWSELPTLWDVDREADLARWRALPAPPLFASSDAKIAQD